MEDKNEHAISNARGWSETIIALVAALEMDFDRLEELRDEREALQDEVKDCEHRKQAEAGGNVCRCDACTALRVWDDEHGEELRELSETAEYEQGYPFKSRDDVYERIQEKPLSVQVRSGWASSKSEFEAEEFEILLSTGGPALRIRGELDGGSPHRAWLEWQDWGTPWTEFHGEGAPSQDVLVTFASQFYFGE